jgi:hypothetical protein
VLCHDEVMSQPATEFPILRQTVLDTEDVRGLAEFYRLLLGLRYRPGDEPPPDGEPDPAGRTGSASPTPMARRGSPSSR